ncbi:hypothetical protein XU18_4462 [Perkinsela sp. CCAP 1560/4]|nr:hypothetical protein XU18_4462 [Perkinsela sp. CCAP 1560/4]|eukprot:KNH04252.1 hypothetical protein XU18_4462 [Perkinsela sp. CCAP 1560/4]
MICQKKCQFSASSKAMSMKNLNLTFLRGVTTTRVLWSPVNRAMSHVPGPFQEGDGSQHEYIQNEIPYSRSRWEIISSYGDSFSEIFSPTNSLMNFLRYLEGTNAIGWGTTFFLLGMLLRLLSLIPGLYVNRNAMRLAKISPELSLISQKIRTARQNNKLNTEDKRVILASFKRQKNQLFAKHNCSMQRNFAQVLMIPFFSCALMAIQRITCNEESVEMARYLWIHDLTMPDPYFILPLACSLLFLLNIELNSSLNRGSRSATAIGFLWFTRFGCLIGLYFCHTQPAAYFIYWLGLSTAGIVQPILLRMESFRKYFKFPPLSDSIVLANESDWLSRRFSIFQNGGKSLSDKQKVATLRDYEVVFDSKAK